MTPKDVDSELYYTESTIETFMSSMKENLLDFHPVWFISIMGTGISTSILYNFPYETYWLKCISYIMFSICTCLLITSTLLLIGKVYVDKERREIFTSMNMSVFLGCYVMGFCSWSTGLYLITKQSRPILSITLWWINVLLSLFTAWVVFFLILRSAILQIDEISATLLLPVVALMVCSSSGQLITDSLPKHLQMMTMIIGFMLWANALALSFILLTIFFMRLLQQGLPPQSAIFTMFIPVGFLGQGAFSIELFGMNYHDYLVHNNPDDTVSLIEALISRNMGIYMSLFLQSFGFCITFHAVCSAMSYGMFQKYHHGFWATTFPLGTMALASLETYKLKGWTAFRIISLVYAVGLLIMTVTCLIGSGIILLKSISHPFLPKKEKKSIV